MALSNHRPRAISFDLTGCTALVTGATGGIGSAISRAFADAGAELVFVIEPGQDPTVRGCGEGIRDVVPLDLANHEGRSDSLGALVEKHAVDIVVNAAGRITRGASASFQDHDWYDVIEVNLHAAFDASRAAGRAMIAGGRGGKIINVASLLSFQGGINVASYAASKHALVGLTRALANEWAGYGINVNAIAPGYVETPLAAALQQDPERYDAITARIPAGRWASPDDIGGAAVFLASAASDYVHGHVLVVDGGWMAR